MDFDTVPRIMEISIAKGSRSFCYSAVLFVRNVEKFFLLGILLLLASGQICSAGEHAPDVKEPDLRCPDAVVIESSALLKERGSWEKESRSGLSGSLPPSSYLSALNSRQSLARSVSPVSMGERWESIGPTPLWLGSIAFTGRVTAITLHPSDPDIAYAGGARGGVWKTSDRGASWVPVTEDVGGVAIGSLVISPNNPQVVYAGTGDAYNPCGDYFGIGILKSVDAGASWTLIAGEYFSDSAVTKIIFDPLSPDILYAANAVSLGVTTCYGLPPICGVWKSTDGGKTWSLILDSASTGLITASVTDLQVDPCNPEILYAGVKYSGIWRSLDGGESWKRLTDGLPAGPVGRVDLAVDPLSPMTLYSILVDAGNGRPAGIFKSMNGGDSWFELPVPSGSCQFWELKDLCTYSFYDVGQCWFDLLIDVSPSGRVWAGGIGLWYSDDGGGSWEDSCGVEQHVDHHAVAFSPVSGDTWSSSDGGIFLQGSGTNRWRQVNGGLSLTQFYPGASLHPDRPTEILAGNQDNGALKYEGNSSWSLEFTGDGSYTAFDSDSPDLVWYISYQYLNILKTTNGGASYNRFVNGLEDANTTNAPVIAPFILCPDTPSILIAGSDNVWISEDGAETWISNSPDPLDPSGAPIKSLAFFGSSSDCSSYVVSTMAGSIYRTLDRGAVWQRISDGLQGGPINSVSPSPHDPDRLYAATGQVEVPHIYVTGDANSAAPLWIPLGDQLPDTPFYDIVEDPLNEGVLYAGSEVGLFKSIDGGEIWEPVLNGHPAVVVYDIVVAPSGTIYSFTHGRGAYRLSRSTRIEEKVDSPRPR